MPDSATTQSKRLDRNWAELLQELRVAQTGVQILTGFMLTLPFTERFHALPESRHNAYAAILTGAVASTLLLMTLSRCTARCSIAASDHGSSRLQTGSRAGAWQPWRSRSWGSCGSSSTS
ncbi:hypothetical protein GCM10022234_23330 [Aeromicrobium panaciterrae]